jgi:hypothetical protein
MRSRRLGGHESGGRAAVTESQQGYAQVAQAPRAVREHRGNCAGKVPGLEQRQQRSGPKAQCFNQSAGRRPSASTSLRAVFSPQASSQTVAGAASAWLSHISAPAAAAAWAGSAAKERSVTTLSRAVWPACPAWLPTVAGAEPRLNRRWKSPWLKATAAASRGSDRDRPASRQLTRPESARENRTMAGSGVRPPARMCDTTATAMAENAPPQPRTKRAARTVMGPPRAPDAGQGSSGPVILPEFGGSVEWCPPPPPRGRHGSFER